MVWLGSTEFKFPTKFSTRQLVTTRFEWRTKPQLERTLVCASEFHDLKKGILGTVRFRFEITTVSNLESQYPKTCQIARLWVPFARLSLLWLRGPQHLLSRILGFEAVIRFATSDSNKGSESLRALNFQSRECWGPFFFKIDKSSAWKPKSKIISVVSN